MDMMEDGSQTSFGKCITKPRSMLLCCSPKVGSLNELSPWVDPADPMGNMGPALLTHFSHEADPTGPTALFFWAGSETQWVDPVHSHPDRYHKLDMMACLMNLEVYDRGFARLNRTWITFIPKMQDVVEIKY
jgi:hypothetical protein